MTILYSLYNNDCETQNNILHNNFKMTNTVCLMKASVLTRGTNEQCA